MTDKNYHDTLKIQTTVKMYKFPNADDYKIVSEGAILFKVRSGNETIQNFVLENVVTYWWE